MTHLRLPALALLLATIALAPGGEAPAPVPHWIWAPGAMSEGQEVHFRKSFTLEAKPAAATLTVTCDNSAVAWVNGQQVLVNGDWQQPGKADVAKHLKAGANVIAIAGKNADGQAGLVARLSIKDAAGKTINVVSDGAWRQGAKAAGWESEGFDDAAWKPSADLGMLGMAPWGDVFGGGGKPAPGAATPADALVLLPGFKAELIYTVPKAEQGSWVSVTTDHKGRLIASAQEGQGMFRITPPPPGGDAEATVVEKIDLPIGAAQGLLYAYDSLYVVVNGNVGGNGSGLYRLQDTDSNDSYDKITKLRGFDGGGEHGPHGVVLGPDNMVYVCAGNHTKLPDKFDRYLAPNNLAEDIFLPRLWDANGHAKGVMAPGGWIARTDAEGKTWEMYSWGYRNQYDIAFDANGELFSWDSDMEWDMGAPWYRPTRVTHSTPGSDFGWRSGSGNTPDYYADFLPPLMDVGPGSPTGAAFGTGAKFPAKYQRALYILDWTFGTAYALHLEPKGAGFTATKEEFVSGRPFPLTDMVIGKDGAMYITVGGRGTQSALYRITYAGSEVTTPAKPLPLGDAVTQRRKLEAFLGRKDPAALAAAWPHLSSPDRFLRFAARQVVEAQPVAEWQDRALAEKDPRARITAIIALAHNADKALQPKALAALLDLDLVKVGPEIELEALRAHQLVISRMGPPETGLAKRLIAALDARYPSSDWRHNRELAALLAVLDAPSVVGKTLALMGRNEATGWDAKELAQVLERNQGYAGPIAQMLAGNQQQQPMHYAMALSVAKSGWTPEQRHQYFAWFDHAEATGKGGNSYKGFLKMIRSAALENVPAGEREAVLAAAAKAAPPKASAAVAVQPKGPGKAWTMAELSPLVQAKLTKRDFANGRGMYAAAQCAACHRFAGEGGSIGPDLSTVGSKFSARDLLESIIEPSKVISDQYQTHAISTKDGDTIIGRIVSEDAKVMQVAANPLVPTDLTEIALAEVTGRVVQKVSAMPPALVDRLNQQEVLDLVAYLLSGGNEQDPAFKP